MAATADIAPHLFEIFDDKLSTNFGYVQKFHKIEIIVQEWELLTNSLFTASMSEKNFGSIGELSETTEKSTRFIQFFCYFYPNANLSLLHFNTKFSKHGEYH